MNGTKNWPTAHRTTPQLLFIHAPQLIWYLLFFGGNVKKIAT